MNNNQSGMMGKNHIKKYACAVLVAAFFALILAGCGGGGGGSSSPWMGRWTGTWGDIDNGDSGTADITIASDGDMTGTVVNDTQSKTATITGHISTNGAATYTWSYPSETYTGAGTGLWFPTQGTDLRCEFTNYDGPALIGGVVLSLTRK